MAVNTLCRADLHLHTNLSFCAPKETQIASYLPLCEAEGITTLGISNHLYATEPMIGDMTYLDYALQARREIEHLRSGTDIRFLLGCESELFPGQMPGLRAEDAHHFDYVLIAASHMFNWIRMYDGIDLSTPDKVRAVMVDQFCRACRLDYDIPVGICHPLYPICCPWEQEVVDGLTDETLADCFSLAAARGVSIEIHACLYRNGTKRDEEGLSPSYLRLLSAAKACGCKFHFGSDAHDPKMFGGVHTRLARAAERIGLTEDDLWSVCK